MKKYRLLITPNQTAAQNMAMDEAILTGVSEGTSEPTLRLYSWTPSAVSIGCFQNLQDEVDLDVCKEQGVDTVRRITGGGAVYHDAEITYSFITTLEDDLVPHGIRESYKVVTQGVIKGLELLGIKAEFVPLNDIVTGGKKISGNAQTRRKRCVLQHGTILLDVDVKKMFSLLKVPNEKIRDKMISAVEERVTSVKQQLGREVLFDEAADVFTKGFAQGLDIELVKEDVSEKEQKLTEQFASEKYAN